MKIEIYILIVISFLFTSCNKREKVDGGNIYNTYSKEFEISKYSNIPDSCYNINVSVVSNWVLTHEIYYFDGKSNRYIYIYSNVDTCDSLGFIHQIIYAKSNNYYILVVVRENRFEKNMSGCYFIKSKKDFINNKIERNDTVITNLALKNIKILFPGFSGVISNLHPKNIKIKLDHDFYRDPFFQRSFRVFLKPSTIQYLTKKAYERIIKERLKNEKGIKIIQ